MPSLAGKLSLESEQTQGGLMRPSGALKLCSAPAGQRVGGGAKDATPSRSDCVFPPLDIRLLPTSTVMFL